MKVITLPLGSNYSIKLKLLQLGQDQAMIQAKRSNQCTEVKVKHVAQVSDSNIDLKAKIKKLPVGQDGIA